MSTVQISAFQPGIAWHWGGATATLRYTYTSDFVDSTGTPILHGLYKDIACTIAAGVLSVPSHSILSTLDALVNPLVTLNAQFIDERGAKRSWLFQNYSVSTTTPTTMGALEIFNQGSGLVLPPDTYLNSQQVQNLINIALGTLNHMSDVVEGRGYSDVAPAVAIHPTLVGRNSPVIPEFTLHASKYASFNLAVAAINALGGGTVVVDSPSPVTTNISVPFTVSVVFSGQGQLTGSGKTVTFVGPLAAPPVQIFASGITVSFAANTSLTEVWVAWWGAVAGGSATTNATAFNATAQALITNNVGTIPGCGLIRLGPGIYDFNATWVIGNPAVNQFTGFSICGTNGFGSTLRWTGSTAGVAISLPNGRLNRFDDCFLLNGVAAGTTIGLQFTGPNAGEMTSGPTLTNVAIGNATAFFNKGVSIGGPGTVSAGEITFINCFIQYNDINIYGTGNGNSIVIRNVNTSCSHASKAGVWMDNGSGGWHIAGGGFAANGTAGDATTGDILLALGFNATVHIQDARFEIGNGTTDAFRGGIVNLQGFGIVNIDNCAVNSTAVPTAVPFLKGVANWCVDGLSTFGDGADGFILYNADGNGSGSLTVRNSRISNSNTRTVPGGGVNTTMLGIQFDPSNSGSQGMKIVAENNFYSDGGGAVIKHDNVEAIIGATPAASGKVFATRRVNSNGQVTEDWLDFGDQDATPSVKWAKAFKYADTGATTQTAFDDMVDGQEITLFFTNGNRTIQNNASQKMAGGVDFVGTANDFLRVRKVGSVAIEVGRAVN